MDFSGVKYERDLSVQKNWSPIPLDNLIATAENQILRK